MEQIMRQNVDINTQQWGILNALMLSIEAKSGEPFIFSLFPTQFGEF